MSQSRHFAIACGAITVGLATAASFDRTAGGVILLAGWFGAIAALHRLGRAGADL